MRVVLYFGYLSLTTYIMQTFSTSLCFPFYFLTSAFWRTKVLDFNEI